MGNKKLIINGQEWVPFVFRNMSFWHQWLSNYGHFYCYKKWGMKVPIKMLSTTTDGVHTHVFKTPENKKESDKDILTLFSTKEKINLLENRYKKFAANLLKLLEDCKKSLTVKNWKKFERDYILYTHGLAITATMGRIGLDELVKKMQEAGIVDTEILGMVPSITYPKTHTPLFNSTLDILKIGEKIQSGALKGEKINEELDEWLKKYSHIPVNFCDEPWSLNDAKKQLENVLRKDCAKEVKELERVHKEKIILAKNKLKEIDNKEVSLLAFALQKAVCLNEYRKNIFSFISLSLRPIFSKIAEMANSDSWTDCYYLIPEETEKILKGKLKSIDDIVKKRKIVAYYMDDKTGKEIFLNDEDKKEFLNF